MIDFVGDNSFYSCFLNDIDRPDILMIYLDNFKHHIGPTIKTEMSKSPKSLKIKDHYNFNYFPESELNISAIVNPLFSDEEKHRGEQEVVAIAYMVYCLNHNLILVIDEKGPRRIIEQNISCLVPCLKGTIGLLVDSVKKYKLLNKIDVLNILDHIEKSDFRVSKIILSNAKMQL